jgi:N-carbamoylputrescine amidase
VVAVVPVVAANRIGVEHDQTFYGTSFIANEWGDVVCDLDDAETGILVSTFDLDQARAHRASMGFFRDRRPALYTRLAEDI